MLLFIKIQERKKDMNYKNPQRYKNGDLQSMIVWSNEDICQYKTINF